MPLRLHVFQHVAHEGLGSLESFFTVRGADIAYTRFFAGDLPPQSSAFDFLIVLGGPMNVDEEKLYPWLAAEKQAIRGALDAGKPVLGLCLGAQLIAVALGGTVTRNAHREIGWWPVEKLPGLAGHRAASCFPDRFTTFHWHGDTFSIPPGATPLFRSEGCANQGFAWGNRKGGAVALQFHPEITAEAIEVWIAEAVSEGGGDLKPGPYVQDAEAMRRDAARTDAIADNNAWLTALCEQMLRAAPVENPPAHPPAHPAKPNPVIFFDGYCGLCNGFVDFMMARDPKVVFRFAPLQGETANARVPEDAVPYDAPGDPRSIVFWESYRIHRRSDAVLRALPLLGGVWKLTVVLRVIPRPLRDLVYDFIARHRYRWFGRRETCRLPGPGERERFLP
jgi:GMP synthase-like glutamine amidotransferase/predicted DCC family thiol-disulfide oxidoreductase YuxK